MQALYRDKDGLTEKLLTGTLNKNQTKKVGSSSSFPVRLDSKQTQRLVRVLKNWFEKQDSFVYYLERE